MKKKFEIKKLFTATNILIVILLIIYLLDRFLPFPEGYTGYNAWIEDVPPAFNYIFGSCGGLLTNYMARGEILENGTAIYRSITLMFLHGHILHLIANLVGLYFIGNYAEKRFGWWLAYIIYFAVGFIESFITDPLFLAIAPSQSAIVTEQPSMGASGGIFGLIGASLATVFFDLKSFKKIGLPTIIVVGIYGFLTTYVVSFGWTTVCHNVAFILGLALGTLIILPFFLLKKGKFAPVVTTPQATETLQADGAPANAQIEEQPDNDTPAAEN